MRFLHVSHMQAVKVQMGVNPSCLSRACTAGTHKEGKLQMKA